MSTRKPRASARDDAASLLRDLLPDVTPLPTPKQALLKKPRPRPIPHQRIRDDRDVLTDSLSDGDHIAEGLETGEELQFIRPGLPAQTLRKLRRGHWVIQREIDLHGLTVVEARPLLAEFLGECRKAGTRCVRVIHGKGLRSKNREPVLKKKVAHWLMQRDEVLAFCQARRTEGGSGAVVVLLKGTRKAIG